MVDSLWFVLALVLLAVVSVALVLVLVLRREEAHCGRETRTEYLQPNYGQTGRFRVSSAPSNETIIPYRYWLIEGQVSEIDYDIVPGRRMSLRTARTGQMLYPAGFFDLAFEDVQQYDIDGVTVTQRQNAGRITGISWTWARAWSSPSPGRRRWCKRHCPVGAAHVRPAAFRGVLLTGRPRAGHARPLRGCRFFIPLPPAPGAGGG